MKKLKLNYCEQWQLTISTIFSLNTFALSECFFVAFICLVLCLSIQLTLEWMAAGKSSGTIFFLYFLSCFTVENVVTFLWLLPRNQKQRKGSERGTVISLLIFFFFAFFYRHIHINVDVLLLQHFSPLAIIHYTESRD